METFIKQVNDETNAVLNGEKDAIQVYKKFKTMADLLNSQINAIFETTLGQCDRYHKDELALMGITIRSGSKKWDYSNCPEWLELNKKKKELEETLQARAKINGEIVDPETGEILFKPIYTIGKPSIIINKAKSVQTVKTM